MPWAPLPEPSLALGILKAQLTQGGVPCTVAHLNIFLLKYLKGTSYELLGSYWGYNDFVFTACLQGHELSHEQERAFDTMLNKTWERLDLREPLAKRERKVHLEYALKIRNEIIPTYLSECLKVVSRVDPTMVGFTCMYDQTFASLALAKLIKEKHPDKLLAFGGTALEGPAGTQIMRCFPFVDVVARGEGEDTVVPLAKASVDRGSLGQIPGLLYRDNQGRVRQHPASPPRADLDHSPFPDYDDFFADVARLSDEHQVEIHNFTLPVESSRGCWWGQTSHCTFCGIDDEALTYRFKTPERVISMLRSVQARYGDKHLRFSDYILPRQYYKTLLPKLAELRAGGEHYLLHWEMKANVKCRDVKLMADAGAVSAQPGIESFSTSVLKKMAKGVTGIQNVLTLKLLAVNDIEANYNFLYGFPNDEVEEYREMTRVLPTLYHLPPPHGYMPVQLTRFAPMHADPNRFGITKPHRAEVAYRAILSPEFMREIQFVPEHYAYIFEIPYSYADDCVAMYDVLTYQIRNWKESLASREVRLSYEITGERIEFVDSRYGSDPTVTTFGWKHALVQHAIDQQILSHRQLVAQLAPKLTGQEIQRILGDFRTNRLIFEEGKKVVGLAFPVACYQRWRLLRRDQSPETEQSEKHVEPADHGQVPGCR